MSISKTPWRGLGKPGIGDTGWGNTLNAIFDAVDQIDSDLRVAVTDQNAGSNTTINIRSGWYDDGSAQTQFSGASGIFHASWSAGGTFYVYLQNGALVLDGVSYPTDCVQLARVTTNVGGGISAIVDDRIRVTVTIPATGGNSVAYDFTDAIGGITYAHNLHRKPSVTVVDTTNEVVNVDVAYDSDDSITLTWNGQLSGTILLV